MVSYPLCVFTEALKPLPVTLIELALIRHAGLIILTGSRELWRRWKTLLHKSEASCMARVIPEDSGIDCHTLESGVFIQML